MKKAMSLLLLLAVFAAGCCSSGCGSFYLAPGTNDVAVVTTPVATVPVVAADGVLRRAVVYGLDGVDPAAYGGWAGACPGTILDALRMRDLLLRRGYSVVMLTNSQATAFRVTAACVAAAQGMRDGDKLVVYGSSHGGQANDVSGDEAGGMDSTICLWDGHFVDDLVLKMLSRVPKGVDVDFITDCCHSGTNWRGQRPHDYVRVFKARPSADALTVVCNFTHWGGCGDGEYSYGSRAGGEFTNALLATGPGELTRKQWFAAADKRMPRNQTPVMNWIGNDVTGEGALK